MLKIKNLTLSLYYLLNVSPIKQYLNPKNKSHGNKRIQHAGFNRDGNPVK